MNYGTKCLSLYLARVSASGPVEADLNKETMHGYKPMGKISWITDNHHYQ